MALKLPGLLQVPSNHENRGKEATGERSCLRRHMLVVKSTDPQASPSAKMLDGSPLSHSWASLTTLSPASSGRCLSTSSLGSSLPTVERAKELDRAQRVLRTDELLSRSIGICSEQKQRPSSSAKPPARSNSTPNLTPDAKRRTPQSLLSLVCQEEDSRRRLTLSGPMRKLLTESFPHLDWRSKTREL